MARVDSSTGLPVAIRRHHVPAMVDTEALRSLAGRLDAEGRAADARAVREAADELDRLRSAAVTALEGIRRLRELTRPDG